MKPLACNKPGRSVVITATAAMFCAAFSPLGAMAATPEGFEGNKKENVQVQILGFNDFHGHLRPPTGSWGRAFQPGSGWVEAGGSEYLSTWLKKLRGKQQNTVTVSSGDVFGGTPLLSGLFHDEPAVEAVDAMGLKYDAVGNHELDEGWSELTRMQTGGCHGRDGCKVSNSFGGAKFKFLSANLRKADTNKPLFAEYAVHSFGDVKVGFVGVTLDNTPNIAPPEAVTGITFEDEIKATNRVVPLLKKEGVSAIVVLLHDGGFQKGFNPNQCNAMTDSFTNKIKQFSPSVDVVLSAHTHTAYNCMVDGKILTSAASYGRMVTDVELSIDPTKKVVTSKRATNVLVTRDVAKDPEQTAIINKYAKHEQPVASRVVGEITGKISRALNEAGESPLGDLIADAQLEAAAPQSMGGAQIVFMNPGGIRTDLFGTGEDGSGKVTYGKLFDVQPFENRISVMTLTGAQIATALEQQFRGRPSKNPRLLQVSHTLTYSFDYSRSSGDKVDEKSIKVDGKPIKMDANYRVGMNSLLANGGDNVSVFKQGTDLVKGPIDIEALGAYLTKHAPVAPPAANRIKRMGVKRTHSMLEFPLFDEDEDGALSKEQWSAEAPY